MKMQHCSVAWISPIPPVPINSGNRKHLNYVLEIFEDIGVEIDFFQYGWEEEAKRNSEILSKRFNNFCFFPQPLQKVMSKDGYWAIDDWVSKEFLDFVENNIRKKYDIVIVEYVWMSKILELFGDDVVKVINAHDVFADRDILLESQGIEKQWYFTRSDQERIGLLRADIILGITQEDCEYYEGLIASSKDREVVHCGSGVVGNKPIKNRKINNNEIAFGYLASSNAMNKESINRFLVELNSHGPFARKFFINVGGNISGHVLDYPNINIFKKGHIKNIDKFYEECDIIIAPMIEGTGLKIKSLEAIEYGKPLVGTKYSTNDLPVDCTWHTFLSIEHMARYIGNWLKSGDIEINKQTISYLQYKSLELNKRLVDRQSAAKDKILNLISGKRKTKKSSASFVNEVKESSKLSVSVIIPAFNTEKYIERCLQSILEDKLKNIEVIVINDGSTDNTAVLVEEISKNDSRVKLISQKNSGQGVARNVGMNNSSGEYLYFVDSDDYIGRNSLYEMYNFCRNNSLDICSPDKPYLSDRPVKYVSALAGWCCFVRRSVIEDPLPIRQPAIKSGQDGVFANMILTRCKSAAVCKSAKYFYEKREESTFNALAKKLEIIPDLVEQHLNVLRDFYENNSIDKSQASRYVLFLQDETYKWRFKAHLKNYRYIDAERIYLAIKSELKYKIEDVDAEARTYLSRDFLEILNMTFDEYMKKFVA